MSASELEMVCHAMQRIVNAFPEAPQSQLIEKYLNTMMRQINISSIAFAARPNEILTEECWSNDWYRIFGT